MENLARRSEEWHLNRDWVVVTVACAVLLIVKLGVGVPWQTALPASLATDARFSPATLAAGLVVGFLVGMTGMGSGALMAPLLILVLHVRPTTAVGTDLVYASVTKLFGAVQHWKHGYVDTRLLLLLSTGSIPGALLGVQALHVLQLRYGDLLDSLLLRSLGLMFILTGATIALRLIRSSTSGESVYRPAAAGPSAAIVLLGAVTGFLVGLTSVGAGSLLMAALLLFYSAPAAALVGTDVVHAVLLTGVAGASHLLAGNVELPLALNLLLGSVPGVLLGSRLVGKLPDRAVRIALAVLLLATGAHLWTRQ